MSTILEGLGFVLTLIGASAADSQNMLFPGMLIGAGMLLMLIGYWSERSMN